MGADVSARRQAVPVRAWGEYDSRSFSKTLKRNGWPKGVRPYVLRHSVGLGLSARDVDLGDIQSHMGHESPATTRIYVPGLAERAQAASTKLDGRIGASFALSHPPFTPSQKQKAKEGKKRPLSARVQEQQIGARRKAGSKKSA